MIGVRIFAMLFSVLAATSADLTGVIPEFHVKKVVPIYPRAALLNEIEGEVVVDFVVNTHGKVSSAIATASTPQGTFDIAAIEAVRGWRYYPKCGRQFEQEFPQSVVVRFKIGESSSTPPQPELDVQLPKLRSMEISQSQGRPILRRTKPCVAQP